MADYVGRWDCICGTQVWGILRHCPNCGANTTGRYYLPENEPPTTAEEVQQIIKAGPNWKCRHCGSDNYGDHGFCTECGGDKGSSTVREVKTYRLNDVPDSADEVRDRVASTPLGGNTHFGDSEIRNSIPSRSLRDIELPRHANPFSSSSLQDSFLQTHYVKLGLLAVVLALIVGGLFLFLRPYDVNSTIDHFEWSRTIYVNQYQTVREGDWAIPPGGRYVSNEQRVHHHVRVFDHYETRTRQVPSGSEQYVCGRTDNGNGTFSDSYCSRTTYRTETYQEEVYRQDPVYQTWYNYDIDKWVPSRTVPTSGTNRNDPIPYWGNLVLACANQATLGCESESNRDEHYIVVFTWNEGDTKREFRLEEDRADWDAYSFSQAYVLRLNGLNQLLNDPLRPEVNETP